MRRDGMVLTKWAEDDRSDFLAEYGSYCGCSCFISPPCGWCLHPGNPRNQDECDECWEPEDFASRIDARLERVRSDLHFTIDRMKGGQA